MKKIIYFCFCLIVFFVGYYLFTQVKSTEAAPNEPNFEESTVYSGLVNPTAIRFSPDGRIFVAEKRGVIKVFDNLSDTTPDIFADLRTNVYNFWDRGLLGLAIDPNFPTNPYIYALYTYDAPIGGTAPFWGTPNVDSDPCPNPPGATSDGCLVSGRLSRLKANGNVMETEEVLINDWCQQYPSHSIGSLAFGSDGALYVSGGDGSSFTFVDYGQDGNPVNPCGDPPGGAGSVLFPPSAEGGSLRSQDLRTLSDPTGLNGSIIRINPATGAALPDNPLYSNPDPNAKRIIGYGLRNPFRITARPGTSEIWVGDVGWDSWEEINRIVSPVDSIIENFGWPCYEGRNRQQGYDGANLDICENLYNEQNAVTEPYYAYHHNDKVVPSENCPTGSSSIAGVVFQFYEGNAYPSEYNGALFFADYSRDCIWVMFKGLDDKPNPSNIKTFITQAANPVDLTVSPEGELYYPDFDGGVIKRIRYLGNLTPTPSPTITPTPSPGGCSTGQYYAEYFNNMTLSDTPIFTRCETAITNYWGPNGPGNGVNADNFSVRWTGTHSFTSGNYTFTALADDGIRGYLDGVQIIDGWKDQSATTYVQTLDVTGANHEVKVEYYENGGDAVAQFGWVLNSASADPCPLNQYQAQYFNNMNLSGAPVLTRCESAVNNNWGAGGPGFGITNDNFSVQWIGNHGFTSGNYTFSATSDDGIRIFIDGSQTIDGWGDHSVTSYSSSQDLTLGNHEVKVEYYENSGDAVAQLDWIQNSQVGDPCPSGQFYAEYFNNITLLGSPIFSRCESFINNNWGQSGPGNGISIDNFSVRWRGNHSFASGSYTFTTTSDDGIRVWLDQNSIINAWVDQSATQYQYTTNVSSGSHEVKVEYYEKGGDAIAIVDWVNNNTNTPPSPQISSPNSTLKWKVGDVINFVGSASDLEDGTLPASSLNWELIMQHCPSNCHSHVIQTFTGVDSGSFSAPDHEYPSYLELKLTARDSGNLETGVSINLDPQTIDLTFQSNPIGGLQLVVGSVSQSSPFTHTVIVGSTNSISAPSPQSLNGKNYEFVSWSDGGAISHNITAPSTNISYTANYQEIPPSAGDGLKGEYYDRKDLTQLKVTRVDPTINFLWEWGSPDPSIGSDSFSVRWSGFVKPTFSETYTFYTTTDDGVRLWINNALIIDKWVNQPPTEWSGNIALTAGQKYVIKMEYYENTRQATALLKWSSGSTPKQIIPQSQLYSQ